MAHTALAIPEPTWEAPITADPPVSPRIAALHQALMETLDPGTRARIHLELGGLALQNKQIESAKRHFQEALVLDPRLDAARRWLAELAERARPEARKGIVRGLMERFSRG